MSACNALRGKAQKAGPYVRRTFSLKGTGRLSGSRRRKATLGEEQRPTNSQGKVCYITAMYFPDKDVTFDIRLVCRGNL